MTIATIAVLMMIAATPPQDPPTPAEKRAAERAEALERYEDRTHVELSFGYLGEWRDDTQRSWQLTSASEAAPPAVGGLVTPFSAAPFSGLRASGLALESRTVWDGVRFTLGMRFPWASFRPGDTVQTVDVGGSQHELIVRSLSMWELRTGLGYELPFKRVTPFVDVLGDVEHLTASIVLDGAPTGWKATGFSLGARAGVRVQVSEVFLVIAAEATVLGSPRYGGTFQAGIAF